MSTRKEDSIKGKAVSTNTKTIALAVIAATLIVILLWGGRDLYLRSQRSVTCPDGSHPVIDIREFTTQYWAYSGKLEVSVADKARVSAVFDPKMLAQVSQALQEAHEFRQYVVAGYNSCAISPTEYGRLELRFKTLDNLAQRIDSLLSKNALSPEEKTALSALVTQYGDLARQISAQ